MVRPRRLRVDWVNAVQRLASAYARHVDAEKPSLWRTLVFPVFAGFLLGAIAGSLFL